MDMEAAEITDRHPLVSLVSACFWVLLWMLSWAKSLVAFVTITLPTWVYAILSYSITLTLNFWNFVALFVISLVALNYFVRFRYLNNYMELKEQPLVKPDVNELHPDVNTDPPPTFHNYLDDFLQAVRVFGFLEKPVFHELARHLQTRRLVAGDSISLDEDKSFYCVVDGMVQVYAQTGQQTESHHGLWDDEDMNGYQLLNEVGAGGTLSSLFTILSLFTENVQLSWQDDSPVNESPINDINGMPVFSQHLQPDTDIPSLHLDTELEESSRGSVRRSSRSSTTSTVHGGPILTSPGRVGMSSPAYLGSSASRSQSFSTYNDQAPSRKPATSVHRGTIARATEDSTLAVIPAEAFKRLTKNFPKATGHMVQVILTRFSRVTFHAAHKYLGLTSEVLRTEKAINDIACHPLPSTFYQLGGLQYLRQRFDSNRTSDAESDYFSASASSSGPDSRKTSEHSSRSSSKAGQQAPPPQTPTEKTQSLPFSRAARDTVQAGDLLVPSSSPSEGFRPSRSYSYINTPRIPKIPEVDGEDGRLLHPSSGFEDFDLREEVMSAIAKSIGLLQPPLSGSDSVETSPRANPVNTRSMSEAFKSPFGSLSLLEGGDDTSSLTASSTHSSGDYMSGLDNEVEILFFPAGSTLVRAGELDTGLFYVIEGFLDIFLPLEHTRSNGVRVKEKLAEHEGEEEGDKGQKKLLFTVKPGGIAGYLSSLCNTASYVDITAKTDVYVGMLSSHALERLLDKRPIVLLTLAKRLISMLSPLILQVDASLDWVQVNAGQVLWRPGDVSDSFYMVINGRLRAITESKTGDVSIVGEYGQGDTVGELDVITSSERRNTVHAIRDTELVRMSRTLFNAISARHPQTTAQLLKMIASRVRHEVDASTNPQGRPKLSDISHNNTNYKTVALLPTSRSIPIVDFARKLHAALESIGASAAFLDQASVSRHLGRHAFTRMGKLKSAGWLADQEQKYRTVLYVADSPVNSSWTQTCIRQADCVMVIGSGNDPSIGEYERLLLSTKTTARKELILLHPSRYVVPGSTREWLKNRPWVHRHMHIELPELSVPLPKVSVLPKDSDAVAALKNLKDKVQSGIQKYRGTATDLRPQRLRHDNDFARLARRICGNSIGLVLGGGGARGIAHLGLIRALEDMEIPIDHIAGTSIGALIGGLYAREGDSISTAARTKQATSRIGNFLRLLTDITYPIVAYTTGHEFNRAIYKAFYDLHIEDMWLPFFCNTTNIMTSRMDIHQTGYAWRYIRASMTLVGLIPPLCDNGHVLVDGGYTDNLPVSTMFSMGTTNVFACDVGSLDDNRPRNFGDTVSGWWILINRYNPFSNAKYIPPITEIQSRLAYVSSVKNLEETKEAKGCIYIQMPVHEYGTLQFSKFDELLELGYDHAKDLLLRTKEEGTLPSPFLEGKDATSSAKRKGRSARRNSV